VTRFSVAASSSVPRVRSCEAAAALMPALALGSLTIAISGASTSGPALYAE